MLKPHLVDEKLQFSIVIVKDPWALAIIVNEAHILLRIPSFRDSVVG